MPRIELAEDTTFPMTQEYYCEMHDGQLCPYCGSDRTYKGGVIPVPGDSTMLSRCCSCFACKATWKESFCLDHYEDT